MTGSALYASLSANRGNAAEGAISTAKSVRPALTLFSQHLRWASIEEAIEIAAKADYGGIAWTVREDAHISPQRVAVELPRAVELTRRAGLGTASIVTALTDASSPYAESILETATGLGIRTYRAQTAYYDYKRGDLPAQLEAARPRVAGLARLNERYGATALFHTHGGHVAGAAWDTWLLLRDFDPDRVAINFDTGLGMMQVGIGWKEFVQFARRHIGSLSLKDYHWQQQAQAGGGRWDAEICQPGRGVVDFRELFGYFQSTGFHGPAEVQFEYQIKVPGRSTPIGLVANSVGQKLEMPKADYVALLKRDADFYAARLRETGLAPMSGIAP